LATAPQANPAIRLTAPRSELGRVVSGQLAAAAKVARKADAGEALLNLALQPANTLLHDGWAWQRTTPARIVRETRNALTAAAADGGFLVHASYAFLRAAEQTGRVGDHLRPIVEAALEAEAMVLESSLPACVVRVGYVYGPQSADFKAYRAAFRIARPYWAGPKSHLQHHVHSTDAARALLEAARRRPAGRLLYATDDRPASFAAFGDHLARLVGNPLPTHIPRIGKPFVRFIIADEHVEMLEIGVHGPAAPKVPGFSPQYVDYRAGLAAVMEDWSRGGNQY
jgi:nucleoside-diphosphate-sugar epimerase